MHSIIKLSTLLVISLFAIACGEDSADDRTKITITGSADQRSPNAPMVDTDAGIDEPDLDGLDNDAAFDDAAMADNDMTLELDMMAIEADAEIQITTISDLDADDWSQLCNRLIGLPDALNITDEDLQFGYCVAQYNELNEDYFEVSRAECGASLFDCIDGLQDEHTLPLTICNDLSAAPQNCAIDPLELDTCIRSLLSTQNEMSTQDVCAPTVESVAAFRTSFDRYKAAQACLTRLAEDCPSL